MLRLLTCLPHLYAPLHAALVLHTQRVGACVNLQLGPVTCDALCRAAHAGLLTCMAYGKNPERSLALLLARLLSYFKFAWLQ